MLTSERNVTYIPSRLDRRMREVASRLYVPMLQIQLYEEELTADEQALLISSLAEDLGDETPGQDLAYKKFSGNGLQNIMRLAKHRQMSTEKLILDLAYSFGLLHGRPEYRRLVKEFCGEDQHVDSAYINFTHGELRVKNQVARRVKMQKNSKLVHILKSFEEIEWKKNRIDFNGSFDAKQVSDAVTSLNKNLRYLKFRSESTSVIWSQVTTG